MLARFIGFPDNDWFNRCVRNFLNVISIGTRNVRDIAPVISLRIHYHRRIIDDRNIPAAIDVVTTDVGPCHIPVPYKYPALVLFMVIAAKSYANADARP
jgi:hypothetical protein